MREFLIELFIVTLISCVCFTRAQVCHLGWVCSWPIKSGFVVENYKSEASKELIFAHKELQDRKGDFYICLTPSDNKCELESNGIEPRTTAGNVCLTVHVFLGAKEADPSDSKEGLGLIEMSLTADDAEQKPQVTEISTLQRNAWNDLSARFSGPLQKFRLQISVALTDNQTFLIFDDIKADNCSNHVCDTDDDFMCDNGNCCKWDRVCNLQNDCFNGKDEETSLCGQMPSGSMCTFEAGLCGWENSKTGSFSIPWKLHQGPSPTTDTGPTRDHTLGTDMGHYLYIETSQGSMLDYATLTSMDLPPTSSTSKGQKCKLRFYYHMLGQTIGKLEIRIDELCRKMSRKRTLWAVRKSQGDKWLYAEVLIPNVTNWYRIFVEGHVGVSNHGDIAIDDLSLSPGCYDRPKQNSSTSIPGISNPDNKSVIANTVSVSTEPITSGVDVHQQHQQQPFNMGIGYIVTITAAAVLLIFGSALVCFGIRKRRGGSRQSRRLEMTSNGSDDNCGAMPVQASAIDMQIRCAVTELNPNYDFIRAKYPEQQLREIPRQSLTLTRLLGQGAFGEVYEGCLKNLCANVMELPVAVKTLPALSSEQAETDFFMEAIIISKFMHKNVVKCLGVCFEDHPRYIVLELLQGGDLRSFLRDSRSKPTQPCTICMEDLVRLALDVANGCRHLEEKHFVHRDIAARNCLLSTRGSGRIAKIADFGMSRDIYSADYYRKDGKAMLPIKWMPPEAFLDGVFTSKTDVWSFGILLWEIYTLGYMPYPGQTNSDVMHFVASGGRLEPPQSCPPRLNKIMLMCWNSVADIRPAFGEIIDHLDMCLQDPEVMGCDLSVCHYPLAECLKDVSVLAKSVTTENSAEGDTSSNVPSGETTADYGGHVASQSREPLLPSPDENC